MSLPAAKTDDSLEPDVSHLVTEDETPVDNPYQDHQMRLLTHVLYTSWSKHPFVAYSDVAIFTSTAEPAIVPDVLLSLDVCEPPGDALEKENRSYFVWRYGKPPDVVIEIVSNNQGGETDKLPRYARIGIDYAVIFDPHGSLGAQPLTVHELRGGHYEKIHPRSRTSRRHMREIVWLQDVELGLTLWKGAFERREDLWLRWCERDGSLLATGEEQRARAEQECARAEQECARAEQEHARAEQERARAEQERARAERLAARLRDLGVAQD